MPVHHRLRHVRQTVHLSLASYGKALSDRNVAQLVGAGFFSEIGDWFNTVALISLAFSFTDSIGGVGGMFAVRMLTRLLLQGPAGSLVDRFAGRVLLFTSQIIMGLVAAAFVLLIDNPHLWLLYLLVVLLEATNCVARPAFMVELRAETPEEQRGATNGALFASSTTAQLIGPALGAFVLAPFGAFVVFLLNGVTFFGIALAVALLRGGLFGGPDIVAAPSEAAAPDATAPPAGYRWLLSRKDLVLYSLVSLSLTLLVQATITVFVLRSNAFGFGDGGVGIFYSAVAIGSITGSIAGGANGSPIPLFACAVAMTISAISLATFGVAGSVIVALVALAVAGFATDFYEVVGLTYFQKAIPESVFGRFYSLFLLALSAGGLLGALAGPVLETSHGIAVTLAALAAPAAILALLLAAMSRRWHAAGTATDEATTPVNA